MWAPLNRRAAAVVLLLLGGASSNAARELEAASGAARELEAASSAARELEVASEEAQELEEARREIETLRAELRSLQRGPQEGTNVSGGVTVQDVPKMDEHGSLIGDGGEPLDPLAGLSQDAQFTALIMMLLALTLLINNVVEKQGVPIPESICTVLVGILGGAVVYSLPVFNGDVFQKFEDTSAREFMLVLIAPIIFAEGYGLKSRKFFQNFTRILSGAFLGTIICSLVTAAFVFYLPPLTGMHLYSFTYVECLTFGVLISSIDPVTTLAIFKAENLVDKGFGHLYYSVLGEAILNDAVALTLFEGLFHLIEAGHMTLDAQNIGELCKDFTIAWFGSLAIGVACGMVAALLLKVARLGHRSQDEDHFHFNVPELGVVLVMAYLPFLIALSYWPPLSPIVSVMFAGITMRHYCHYNLTLMTRQVFLPFLELAASLSETYAFLLLGVAVFLLIEKNKFSAPLIGWACVGCLVGRAVNVYPLNMLVNCCSKSQRVTRKEMHVIWFAGLRGVVSLVCALRFPENEEHQNRDVFLCTTVIVIFISMLFLGWPTSAFMRWQALEPPQPALGAGGPRSSRLQEYIEGSEKMSRLSDAFRQFLMTKDGFQERLSRGTGARQSAASGARQSAASGGTAAEPGSAAAVPGAGMPRPCQLLASAERPSNASVQKRSIVNP